jgi:hypothetical protein
MRSARAGVAVIVTGLATSGAAERFSALPQATPITSSATARLSATGTVLTYPSTFRFSPSVPKCVIAFVSGTALLVV